LPEDTEATDNERTPLTFGKNEDATTAATAGLFRDGKTD
jgi:hypothetical protein